MQGRDQRQKEDKVESTPDPVDLFFHAKFPPLLLLPEISEGKEQGLPVRRRTEIEERGDTPYPGQETDSWRLRQSTEGLEADRKG